MAIEDERFSSALAAQNANGVGTAIAKVLLITMKVVFAEPVFNVVGERLLVPRGGGDVAQSGGQFHEILLVDVVDYFLFECFEIHAILLRGEFPRWKVLS